MVVALARRSARLLRRGRHQPTVAASCQCCRSKTAQRSASSLSPWDMGLTRRTQAARPSPGATGTQHGHTPALQAFSELLCPELSDALAKMDVHAPNQMQLVCVRAPAPYSADPARKLCDVAGEGGGGAARFVSSIRQLTSPLCPGAATGCIGSDAAWRST